ncbi:zinc finger, C2H2 type [Necator americanus]|uniref:Zinc finger protein unc-98 n=1 Tax=Necator americanus TaxID=51031 RepID=W2TB50_NECAM|nr:zinc finger, C2H2 type [Necator americanus]ETN79250.1 zinc finger, C2H2 type [Necator americanus]
MERLKMDDDTLPSPTAITDTSITATQDDNSTTYSATNTTISNLPSNATSNPTSNITSNPSSNPTSNPRPENIPRALDKLDSSVESDPLTVVEKDDNGFVFYKCRFCGLTFNYMNTLRAHERVHNVSQPYVCGKCGESYEFACQLEYHTLQHSDMKGYKCECGRTFFSYTEMLYHKHPEDIEKEKEEKELYGCPILVHPSTSRVALLQDMPTPAFVEQGFEPKHPMKVYSDVRSKPYICEYCSKSYADSRQLAYHMYSHRGERQFNPRSSRYLMGRQGIGYTDRKSYFLFPMTSGYVPPTGIMGLLARNAIDMSGLSMRITPERMRVAHFTFPIRYFQQVYIINRPPENDFRNFIFASFSLEVWFMLLITILGVAMLREY